MIPYTAGLVRDPAEDEELETWLPVSGCMVRASRRGSGNRPVLEVFAAGDLIGVTVAGPRPGWPAGQAGAARPGAPGGTVRGRRTWGQPWALAWGWAAGGPAPVLGFGPSGLRHQRRYVEPARIAGTFWIGEAAGRFRSVAIGTEPGVRLHRVAPRT